MKFLLKLILNALLVLALAYTLGGVSVNGFGTALLVALVLSILNTIIKPILIFLTLPATIITLGLFLLVINAIIILMADSLVGGFSVDGFWWALLFSLLLSIIHSVLDSLISDKKED